MSKLKHNMAGTKIYMSWKAMRQRCSNPNHISYKNYGGRGIKVCEEWDNSFEAFYRDMGDRPEGATLDRVDNNKGYCKDNCKWVSRKDNNRNKRNNKQILVDGIPRTIAEIAEILDIHPQTLYKRLKLGWSIDRLLREKPFIGKNQHTQGAIQCGYY